MHYLISILLFAGCYIGFGTLLNQPRYQSRTFSYRGFFRYFFLAATLALPFLIAAGGGFALAGAAVAGLLLGVYGRKIGLDLKQNCKS